MLFDYSYDDFDDDPMNLDMGPENAIKDERKRICIIKDMGDCLLRLLEVEDTPTIDSDGRAECYSHISGIMALIDDELKGNISDDYYTFLRMQRVVKEIQLKSKLNCKYDKKEKQIYLYRGNIERANKCRGVASKLMLRGDFLHELGIAYMDDGKSISEIDFCTYEIEQILADLFMLNYAKNFEENPDISKIASWPSQVLFREGLGLDICYKWREGKCLSDECKASRREFLVELYKGKFEERLWQKSIKQTRYTI